MNPEEGVSLSPTKALTMKARTNCRLDRVYIIVGGLGGFGLEVADWLVARGTCDIFMIPYLLFSIHLVSYTRF